MRFDNGGEYNVVGFNIVCYLQNKGLSKAMAQKHHWKCLMKRNLT